MAYSLPGPDCGARTAVAIAAHQPGNRLYVALAAADPTPDDRTCVEPQSLAMTLHARSDGSYEAVSGASPCEHERFFVSARVESGGTSIVRYENANGCEYDFTIDGAVRWV